MKIILIYLACSIVILTNYAFAENPQELPIEQEKNQLDKNALLPPISNKKSEKMQVSVLPYTQVWVILPGGGVAVRSQKEHLGVQVDGNFAYANGGYFGRMAFSQASVSAIYYPLAHKDPSGHGLNMTLGLGLLHEFKGDTEFLWGPLSIGYQGKRFFFDLGVSATGLLLIGHSIFNNNKAFIFSHPSYYPALKFGLCF